MARILIIDEENISVRGIKYIIEKNLNGVDCFVSRTCSAGLRELDANDYSLLILDMMLPVGDWYIKSERADNLYGLDLLEVIRKKYTDLEIICYTVINEKQIIEKIKSLRAHHICKIMNNSREELLSLMKKLIRKK